MPFKKKKCWKEFGQMADKTLSPTADNCFVNVCVCLFFGCTHKHTDTHRQRKQKLQCVGAGQFDVHFSYRLPVCLPWRGPDAACPPLLLSAGGLGCRLWLRDPLLLCSSSWCQKGLRRRGQYYGTACRGTHTPPPIPCPLLFFFLYWSSLAFSPVNCALPLGRRYW